MKPKTAALSVLLAGSLGGAALSSSTNQRPGADVNVTIDVPVKIEIAPTYAGPSTGMCSLKDGFRNGDPKVRRISS